VKLVTYCGQLEYTRICAPSLLRYSRPPYELLFLDCDSLDGTAEYLDGFPAAAPVKVEVVRVPAEPPLGPGRKEDTVAIRGDFVALVNIDTIVKGVSEKLPKSWRLRKMGAEPDRPPSAAPRNRAASWRSTSVPRP
jgi:hypothetical protein